MTLLHVHLYTFDPKLHTEVVYKIRPDRSIAVMVIAGGFGWNTPRVNAWTPSVAKVCHYPVLDCAVPDFLERR